MLDECCQKGTQAQNDIKKFKKDLDVLCDENRLRILCLLKKHKELCVCDIYESLGLPQNLVSYHLGRLKDTGFLISKKKGAKVIYRPGGQLAKTLGKLISLLK